MGVTTFEPLTDLLTEYTETPEGAVAVQPASFDDVARVLRHVSEHGLNLQVVGGGTHSGFGRPPDPDVLLLMGGLSTVEAWEPDDLTVVAGAGTQVAALEEMLGGRRQTAALPEVPGLSTIGGVVASGASGFKRARLYGTRERVLEVTAVTGDGRLIRGGGRVVKNVTGYDLPRLMVGAFGSLGVIVEVCFKLWPVPSHRASVEIESPQAAASITRPLAVLEENNRTRIYLWGTKADVESQAGTLGGVAVWGHDWPDDPKDEVCWSLRVPPALVSAAVAELPAEWTYVAVHGAGEIRAASPALDGAGEVRVWAESNGGHLIVTEPPAEGLGDFDPWGEAPPALEAQRRLIAQFDPARVINPGRLPGEL